MWVPDLIGMPVAANLLNLYEFQTLWPIKNKSVSKLTPSHEIEIVDEKL